LTKAVTHLIAAVPSGKKYEHALGWEIKVVSWEWFEQSMARGMTLEEKLYNPTLPPEKRGKGAWERQGTTSSTLALGKRFREAGQVDTGMLNPLRRKLRRAASSKLDSQSEALWADITAGSYDQKKNEEDDWTDAKPGKQEPQLDDVSHPQAIDTDEEPTANPAPHSRGPFLDDDDGIFAGRIVFPHGFDLKKVFWTISIVYQS
jgi:DNA replication regulator DPB11